MTDTRFDVLAIGNAIVDIIADTDDAFIASEGLTKDASLKYVFWKPNPKKSIFENAADEVAG